MTRPKLSKRATRYSLGIVAVIAALFIVIPSFQSMAGPEGGDLVTDTDREEINLAQLRLSILSQQIVVATVEKELLGPAQEIAEQRVAEMEANLSAATIQFDNSSKLFEQRVVSQQEKNLQAAKRDAVAAELKIVKAEREAARKSVKLKEANIALLELRKKMAEAELQQLRNKVRNSNP